MALDTSEASRASNTTGRWRTAGMAGATGLLALLAAVVGSLLTGARVGAVTGTVEALSAMSSTWLGDATSVIPLGYAFGAGMVAAVNPCGFAMLPAYLGLYLGAGGNESSSYTAIRRVGQALVVSLVVTAGFVLLFGAAGLLIGAGAQAVAAYFPWIGLAIGVLLIVAGAWMLGGGALYTALGERVAAGIGNPTQTDARGYFLFGISYGTASLSCTLPIFLAVVGSSVAVTGLGAASFQFILYALGMGFVILVLTLGIALFKQVLVGKLRQGLRYVQPASAVLLVLAGAYIVYYWLTLGGLLEVMRFK